MDIAIPKDAIDITFVVPCHNEEENVESVLDTIKAAMAIRALTYETLVIDDGSTDNTSAVVRTYQMAHPELPVRPHRHPSNQGLGASYFEGAVMGKGRYYMLVNGDGDLPMESLLNIVDRMGEADIISPYLSNQYDRPLTRRVLSLMFKKLVDLLGGYRLHYYNGPVLHRRVNILETKTKARGFGYQAELLCHLLRKGCSVIEVPFASVYRHHQTDAFHLANILSVSKSLYHIFLTRFNSITD